MPEKCAACLQEMDMDEVIKCTGCKVTYHDQCVGTVLKDMTASRLAVWVCPDCWNKKPKSDNSNTPVRKDLSPAIDNVTRRKRIAKATDEQCSSCLSRADLTDIVRREIRNAMNESKADNRAYITAQFQDFKKQISDLESSLTFICEKYEDFKNYIQEVKPEIQRLTAENTQLKSSVQLLTDRLNQVEQLARASNVEIQCVPEHSGENLVTLVQQIGNTIEHPVQQQEILQCTRLAKMNPSNPRPRSILVKFASPRIRESFITANRKYNRTHPNDKLNTSHLGIASQSKSPVYVAEHLTKETRELHKAARLRAKEVGYGIVWVTNGRVYLRKSEGTDYVWVRNVEVLKTLKP